LTTADQNDNQSVRLTFLY